MDRIFEYFRLRRVIVRKYKSLDSHVHINLLLVIICLDVHSVSKLVVSTNLTNKQFKKPVAAKATNVTNSEDPKHVMKILAHFDKNFPGI